MTEIPMSYGHIDLDIFREHTKELARNFPPNHPWDKLAVEWPGLGTESIVVEIGGYHGLWSFRMAERYNPRLFIFEPQPWCCQVIEEVMKGYNFKLYPYALGSKVGDFPVFEYETDGCTFDDREDRGWGKRNLHMENIWKVFEKEGLEHIDILNMNAEGWEFVLIPYMFKHKIFPDVFMFQGHDESREDALRELIKVHYYSLWDWGTALSAWKKKE